ncbi:hypothetical protein [Phenylobacterium sp.]|uniref:hypothetical protein n=1 Tax=Phenylobacterium sp. TaxID=1871053 RepID=UPI00286D4A5D|nr:hypothetical protein [Phenylobacterium sp.]
MHITKITAGQYGPPALNFPGGVAGATAALNDPSAALGGQLKAYQALAGRWREAGHEERAALAPTLIDSPFAKRVQSTVDAFSRAAWAGPDATPPAPQAKMLEAFDALSEADQEIVAAMQLDASGQPANASPSDYRARLQADLDAVPAAEQRRPRDTVTLSKEALDRLAGETDPAPVAPRPSSEGRTRADLAAAVAAYARVAG